MVKSRSLYLLMCLVLVFTLAGVFMATGVAAQSPTATPTPTPTTTTTPTATATPSPTPLIPEIKLTCDIPSYSDNSGSTFYYNVNLTYSGNDTVTTNLSLTPAKGWSSYITYSSKEVSSVPMGPLSYGSPDSKTLSINFSPNSGNSPDPGEYVVTLKATAGNLSSTIDLKAIVKAKYSFSMTSTSGKLNTTAVAGKENHFSLDLSNTGTATLENINLTSSMPSDWTIKFNPSNIASLSAGQMQQADVIITPPDGKTVAGDYMITLRSSNNNVSSSTDIRVTVETSSIWGVISIAIIVVVIGGLAVLFLKLGRR